MCEDHDQWFGSKINMYQTIDLNMQLLALHFVTTNP